MRRNVTARLATLMGFVAVAALLFAASASARPRECVGKFTLTQQVRWGDVTLAPGEYTFELDITNDLITVKGEHKAVAIMSQEHDTNNHIESSALILVSRGETRVVRALQLRLARRRLVFDYAVPKQIREEVALEPMVVQRVAVTAGAD